uniref:Uncharacterized protein n=1 Tax=uncultured prokaryote TaxID=198431 RepID=A0A0H5Q3R5_9ZZZZ|nr:hypothetical protein [uncultured prokaryote]
MYHPHALLELSGRLLGTGGPNEIWTCGLRVVGFNDKGAVPEDLIEGFLDTATNQGPNPVATYQLIQQWFTTITNGMSSRATLETVKLNNIGPDGLYSNKTTTHLRDLAGINGGRAQVGPAFTSVAYTWETGIGRGPAHRGRIYPPNFTYQFVGSEIAIADANEAAAAASDLLHTVSDWAPDDGGTDGLVPIVASDIGAAFHYITGATCDTVVDVQRRRKNAIKGTRSSIHSP